MSGDRLQRGLRATFIGMVTNTFLAIGKMTAGTLGHSHALVADGVESLADILSSLVVWRGLVVAAAPADEDHPYGHGKAESMAAAVVATLLLVAAGWIGVVAVREILRPHTAPAAFTLVVLVVVVGIKEALFRFAWREGSELRSTAVRTDAWHHRSDAITSLAAGVGISIALVGGKGWEAADDWAALFAAGMIAWNGTRLLRPAVNELMDASPEPGLIERIRSLAAGIEGVHRVEKCLVRKMGHLHFADMHIEVEPEMTVLRAHEIAHRVKDRIRGELPEVADVLVHVEPAGGSRG